MESKEIWWKQTFASSHFMEKILESLIQERSVLFLDFNHIPWASYFRRIIADSFKKMSCGKSEIRIPEDKGFQNIEEYMFDKYYTDNSSKHKLRDNDYIEFLAENDNIIFHNKFFLVDLNENTLDQWINFITKYIQLRGERKKAIFLLLLNSATRDTTKMSATKEVEVFSFTHNTEYDHTVFAMLASSSLKISTISKKYLVELACNVTGDNVELCSECLQLHDDFLKDPSKTLKSIVESKTDSCGNKFPERTEKEIEQAIWTAQIRTFYPLLEEYRNRFINKYKEKIEEILKFVQIEHKITKKKITKAEECELSDLYKLTTSKILEIDKKTQNKLDKNFISTHPDQIQKYLPIAIKRKDGTIKKLTNMEDCELQDFIFMKKQIPSIEEEQLKDLHKYFTTKHSDTIKKHLPLKRKDGTTIQTLTDCEPLDIKFMITTNLWNINKEEMTNLLIFKQARNALSHLHSLSFINKDEEKIFEKITKDFTNPKWYPAIKTILNTSFVKKKAD